MQLRERTRAARLLIADNFAVALNDQFRRVVLVKHAVARFERNPSAGLRGIRLTTLGDAGSVVHYEHVDAVAFD